MHRPPPNARDLFLKALELEEAERGAFLDGACGPDIMLRSRVEELLRDHRPDSFLECPGIGFEETVVSPGIPLAEGPGTVIDRYKLLQQIGEGGMGVVYMAEQEQPVRRRVALKIIKLGMDTRQVVARFEAERQALAMMDHPNIARVLDGGTTDSGRPYFVMELVQGVPITEFCDKNRLTAQARLKLFIQVCQAIQSAHQKGIIHRDIKPSNVLVTLHHGDPMPKVIDFGIAKATNQKLTEKTLFTHHARMIGTPAYMSPEQAEMSSMDVDTRADIYSLGVLLYELLTGTTPFPEKRLRSLGIGEMQRVILEEEPERPSLRLSTLEERQKTMVARNRGEALAALGTLLRGDLDWVVMKCLEKDRTRRYETANALANDIKRHLGNEPVVARPPSAAYRLQKMVRRNQLAVVASAFVVCALLLGAVVSAWQAARARQARNEASANEQKAIQAQSSERGERNRAEAEKHRAQLAEASSREQVVRLSVANGIRLQQEGDPTGALLWFAQTLRLVQGNVEAERIHRLRYASALQQCPRLVQLFQCENPLNFAAFSPDGRAVLTTAFGGARVWDASSGEPATPPLLHRKVNDVSVVGSVWHGAFSPDGTQVVTSGDDHTARIWDARTGQHRATLLHSNWVFHAEFSPDGRKVISANLGDRNFIWDARTGEPLVALDHPKGLHAARFSPDGKLAATAGWDGTARVWRTETGERLHIFRHDKTILGLGFSRDGRYLATGSMDKTACVWDVSLGVSIGVPLAHSEYVEHVCFSADGTRLITACRSRAYLWDTASGRLRFEIPYNDDSGKWPTFPVFNPAGNLVVTSPDGPNLRLLDAETGRIRDPALPHNAGVAHAEFAGDSRRLVTASNDGFARIWDLSDVSAAMTSGVTSHINRVVFSPKRERFVIPTASWAAQVYDAGTRRPTGPPLQHANSVVHACFSPDGKKVATVGRDQAARIWDATSGVALTPWMEVKPRIDGAGGFACFNRDGGRLLLASLTGARVWDATNGQPVTPPIALDGMLEHAGFSHDGSRFVSACYDGTVRVWSAETGLAATPPLKHATTVTWAAFSPDDRLVATSSLDRTARVWDAVTGDPVTPPLVHPDGVMAVAFAESGGEVWSVTATGAWAWKLVPELRPVEMLGREARVLAARRIDSAGSLAALTGQELDSEWQRFHGDITGPAGAHAGGRPLPLVESAAIAFLASLPFFRERAEARADHRSTPVDLSPHFNLRLGEILKFPEEDLSLLAQGRRNLGGVEFHLGPGMIQLTGGVLEVFRRSEAAEHGFPTQVTGIAVRRSARLLHFLQGTRIPRRGELLARYIIRYRDGQTWEIPVTGEEADDVGRRSDSEFPRGKRALVVATVPVGLPVGVRLMKFSWENPLPDLEIATIDYVTEKTWGAAYLLAISVE